MALLKGPRNDSALLQFRPLIRGLRGDGRDERFAQIDLRATAITGHVLILAVVTAFLVEIARGHSGNPYEWLGALAGVTYILAVAFLRWRSLWHRADCRNTRRR